LDTRAPLKPTREQKIIYPTTFLVLSKEACLFSFGCEVDCGGSQKRQRVWHLYSGVNNDNFPFAFFLDFYLHFFVYCLIKEKSAFVCVPVLK